MPRLRKESGSPPSPATAALLCAKNLALLLHYLPASAAPLRLRCSPTVFTRKLALLMLTNTVAAAALLHPPGSWHCWPESPIPSSCRKRRPESWRVGPVRGEGGQEAVEASAFSGTDVRRICAGISCYDTAEFSLLMPFRAMSCHAVPCCAHLASSAAPRLPHYCCLVAAPPCLPHRCTAPPRFSHQAPQRSLQRFVTSSPRPSRWGSLWVTCSLSGWIRVGGLAAWANV